MSIPEVPQVFAGIISDARGVRRAWREQLPTPENLLSVLPKELAAALFAAARPHHLKADQTLFTAGDPGDGCYRVESGLLKVTVMSASGRERILAILGPGALVGELAMIDAQPRSASVVAARNSKLSYISRLTFEKVSEAHPEVYRHIVNLLVRRLRDTNSVITAMTSCRSKAGSPTPCSASPRRSGRTSDRDELWCARKSPRRTSPR